MSQRQFRKVYGHSSIAPPNDSSDEEYEPLYVRSTTRSTYAGLVVSSSDESDHERADAPEEPDPGETSSSASLGAIKKTKRRPRRRNFAKEKDELDEIDRSIKEVNELLGEPEAAPAPVPQPAPDQFHLIFSVTYKKLNVSNEMTRIFGDDPEQPATRRGRQADLRKFRYSIIPKEYNFKRHGLSMSMRREDNGLNYFSYDHSRDYQQRHKDFLVNLLQRQIFSMGPLEESFEKMHVEGLLEATDLLFRSDNSVHACELIEKIVAYMQYVAHPLFNFTDTNTRLDYSIAENRPFHIVILKYLYIVSNRACHKTALELAKMLFNLDPSDPLAVVFIIDTLAIRAREFRWLIRAIEYLDRNRQAGYLFNIKYSNAVAHFHVANRNREDLGPSDELLQQAMIAFPWVVKDLLKNAKVSSCRLVDQHELFNSYGNTPNCSNLKRVTALYGALIGSWWSDADVVQWVIRNVEALANKYDNDPTVKEAVQRMEDVRCAVFSSMPSEVVRHLHVIKYMSDLVADGMVPPMENMLCFDPRPPRASINRYNYGTQPTMTYLQLSFNEALVSNFFASMNPNFDMQREE